MEDSIREMRMLMILIYLLNISYPLNQSRYGHVQKPMSKFAKINGFILRAILEKPPDLKTKITMSRKQKFHG